MATNAFSGARRGGLLVAREQGVDGVGDRVEMLVVVDGDVELGHDPARAAALGALLEERQVRVGDVLVLWVI